MNTASKKRNVTNKELMLQTNKVIIENNFIYSVFNQLKKDVKNANGVIINKELAIELKRIEKNLDKDISILISMLDKNELIKLIANNVQFNSKQVVKLALKYDDLETVQTYDKKHKSEIRNNVLFLPLRRKEKNQSEIFNEFLTIFEDYKCTELAIAKIILKIAPNYFKENNLIELFEPIEFETSLDELHNYLVNTYKISLVEFHKIVNEFKNVPLKDAIKLNELKIKQVETIDKTIEQIESLGYKVEKINVLENIDVTN
jgi:hypothetical protein